MKICIHGKAARECPCSVPYGRFYGCISNERAILDIDWCGKIPEECKGYPKDKVNNADTH